MVKMEKLFLLLFEKKKKKKEAEMKIHSTILKYNLHLIAILKKKKKKKKKTAKSINMARRNIR
jgi:hypothetical protein